MAYQGKSALVTGGGSGMGQLAARQFAAAGAHVAIFDVNEAGMQETVGDSELIHSYVVDITDYAAVNAAVQEYEAAYGPLAGILGVSDEPLASCDFNHDPRSGIVDLTQTRVSGQQISVLVWFDNEWAYANRMLDVVQHWLA